jgi:hypothetical protein
MPLADRDQRWRRRRRRAAAPRPRPSTGAAALLSLLLATQPAAAATGPFAPPLVFVAARGEELLLRLPGFDTSGRALSATVLSLPSAGGAQALASPAVAAAAVSASAAASMLPPAPAGQLSELSQLFLAQGLQPRRGRALGAAPSALEPGNRLLFTAPAGAPPLGAWGAFQYRVADGPHASTPGTVWLLPPHGRLAHSDFRGDLDGWRVAGKATLSREGFSRGALSQYLVATDAAAKAGSAGARGAAAAAGGSGGGSGGASAGPGSAGPGRGGDAGMWRFVAPAHFLGNKVAAYGGVLAFTSGAFAGDFADSGAISARAPLATLECASCRGGQGVRLGFFAADAATAAATALDGKTKKFSLPLLPLHWRRDPRNSLQPWAPLASDCELVQVLSALSQLTVLGDQTSWFETVALDDVMLQVASPYAGIPRPCYT